MDHFFSFDTIIIIYAGPWTLNSGGASVVVSVGNPVLKDYSGCNYDLGNNTSGGIISNIEMVNDATKEIREKVKTGYLEQILKSYLINKKNNSRSLKLKDYVYDDEKYSSRKNTISSILKNDDVSGLLRDINENFSISTGIPSIRS